MRLPISLHAVFSMIIYKFSANVGSAIGMILSSICQSVRLTIRPWRCALPATSYSKSVCTSEQEVSHRNTTLPLSTTPTPFHQTSLLLNRRRWCHLANKLKPRCKQVKTIEIFTSGIAILSMQQGYSRQRHTIGSLASPAMGHWGTCPPSTSNCL